MMKNCIKWLGVVMFISIVGYVSYTNRNSDQLSNLMLANIEALAYDESGIKAYQYSWTETTNVVENECSTTTYYVTHYDCMSGGNNSCQKFSISGSETIRKPDCPDYN